MSHGRSEPDGLHGLRQQVIEAKDGPLELRTTKDKENKPGEEKGSSAPDRECSGRKVPVCSREIKSH